MNFLNKRKTIQQEETASSLYNFCESYLLQTALSFSLLLPSEESKAIADETIRETVGFFLTESKRTIRLPLKKEAGNSLLLACKRSYHIRIAGTLAAPKVEDSMTSSLLSMKGNSRDYLTWHYVNHFTTAQIQAMTTQPLSSIKKELWNYRRQWQEQTGSLSPFFPDEIIGENRFLLLADYFDNTPSSPGEVTLAAQLNNSSVNGEKHNALELILRCRIAGNLLWKEHEEENKKTFFSAKEFLEIARQSIAHNIPR